MKFDEKLISYATVRELEYIKAYEKHGSYKLTAAALGVNAKSVWDAILRLKTRAAQKGYSPEHDMTRTVPDGFKVKGVSTYYNADGVPSGQWVKSGVDQEAQEAIMRAAFNAMSEDIPRANPTQTPEAVEQQLATLYTFTDSHVGMLSWKKETGEDWNLDIAEKTLVGCFEKMIEASPNARTGIVNQLGDFLHQDSVEPVTPSSRHLLDSDGRFAKVVATAIRILRRIVDGALRKHQEVIVVIAEGNHDISSSIWLRVMFKALYENEPRLKVIDSELPYYVHQHGSTMLGFHHGHLKKNDQLPLLFASQFPKIWGNTTKRYVHTGHRHHIEEKEHSGITVIQHPTLAARDAYAARGGWLSERQVKAITYHLLYGEVGRVAVVPEMLWEGGNSTSSTQ